MTTVKFGDFTAIPGVRVENTKSKYAAKAVIDTLVLDDIDKDYDNFGAQSYTDWFHGINLRYDAGDDPVLRGAVTHAIGRPNYEQLAPTRSEEHTSEIQSQMRISYDSVCLKKK